MQSLKSFFKTLLYHGLESFGKYYSTYQAIVTNVDDPENRNRIKVIIPNITQKTEHTKWVVAKGQFSGKDYGAHVLPNIGDLVEVSFDFGDVRFPRWEFSGYLLDEKPKEFVPGSYGFKTPGGHIVTLNDTDNIIGVIHKDGAVFRIEKERILVEHYDICSIILHDEYIKALYGEKTIEVDEEKIHILHSEDRGITMDNEKIIVNHSKDRDIIMTDDNITVNGGKQLGVPLSKNVVERLNALEKAHNKLATDYKTHTHTSSSPGSPTSPLVKPYTEANLQETKTQDIVNETLIQ